MTEANKLGSDRYYDISKTGNNITTTLPEKLKDTSGNTIREGETYRVFVASMGNQQGDTPICSLVPQPRLPL